MTNEELIARLRQDDTDFWHCEAADRIDELETKLAAIDGLMVRRIKHHQEMKDLKGSGTAQKREHYRMHVLSEVLGEIRKVVTGESHD